MSSGVPLRLRFSEVAQILGLRQKQVSDLVSRGELPVALVGEQARIPASALLPFIAGHNAGAIASEGTALIDPPSVWLSTSTRNSRKRRYGTGSVYQRSADGLWCGAIRDGATSRVVYARSRKAAENKLARLKAEIRKSASAPVRLPKLSVFLDQWLIESVRPRVRPLTYASYTLNVRKHLDPDLGHIRLDQLRPDHLQKLMNSKLLDGLSPKTVRYIRQVLSNALNQAIRWNLISRNIATLVSPPRVQRFETSPFNEGEARQFLRSVSGHRLAALFTLGLALGLRQSEALGLRWTDIDLEAGVLTIRYQLMRVSGQWQLAEPKTKSSRRTLALPRIVIEALKDRRRSQEQERETAGARWTESPLVFTTSRGTPLHSSDVVVSFHKALAAAGLKRRRFHDLRHSCATLHLVQAISPRVVMEILGHSEIAVTMETYTHVPNALKRQAADRIDELLRPSSQYEEANRFHS